MPSRTESPTTALTPAPDIPFMEKWTDLQAKLYERDDDYVMVREIRYPVSQHHGKYTFQDLYEIIDTWEQSGLRHPLSASQRTAEDLLFFDFVYSYVETVAPS